jgi:hypothetical protein
MTRKIRNTRETAKWPAVRRDPPSRVAKKLILERLRKDTEEVNGDALLTGLRKQGYQELPLEDIQDRLSKLRTSLAEFIVSRRG